jgi:GNAT superfamily N-acetyltransferase
MTLHIAPLQASQRAQWEPLARGYKAFYRTEVTGADLDAAWQRLVHGDGVFGFGAALDGRLVGIVHALFHTSTWNSRVCYLQDLFVAPESRGHGVARALIETVAGAARGARAERCYWLTQENNTTARLLYDKVARFNGFIRYDLSL